MNDHMDKLVHSETAPGKVDDGDGADNNQSLVRQHGLLP